MTYIFVLGFLFGIRHALDADHIAAVAALATRSRSTRETLRTGLSWGLGHALTLFLVCAAVLLSDAALKQNVALLAEFAVGVMLVGLGADVLRRAVRDRKHVHAHRHGAGEVHLHLHSHAGEGDHAQSAHAHLHDHATGIVPRALVVGLMHGMAGSAALVVVAAAEIVDVWSGLTYVALFGAGSILGMGALSLTIALPLRSAQRVATWGFSGINLAVGLGTAALGATVMVQTGPALAAWLGQG
jgi:ABC-type nickel/cobalt efflux system permease component RcnA